MPDRPTRQAPVPAVFLDRDGVINELVWDEETASYESPYDASSVSLVEGAVEALHVLRRTPAKLIVVSNQPNAAKRRVTLDALRSVHERVESLLAEGGVHLDGYRYCHHHPEGTDPALTVACACRKPKPGLLLAAAREWCLDLGASWMVGDSDTDIEAGRRAGCRSILVENPLSAHRRGTHARPDARVAHLGEAAAHIIRAFGRWA